MGTYTSVFGNVVLTLQSDQNTDVSIDFDRSFLRKMSENDLKFKSEEIYETCKKFERKSKGREDRKDGNNRNFVMNVEEVEKRKKELLSELITKIYNKSLDIDKKNPFRRSSLDVSNLENKDSAQLREILKFLAEGLKDEGSALVCALKRRDALRRLQASRFSVITDHLRKRAAEKPKMRFSIEPVPGESGFSQWLSAMKMVAQLPEGIPPEFRRKLWLSLADRHLLSKGVDWSRVEKDCFSEWSHPADSELGVQIVKDLHRTGCSLFCGENGQENQILLKRVLLAYARWNKAVGYCQGFNMLAALILQVTEKCEPEALKIMIFLVEGVLPESYFADNLRGLSVDMAVFRELLRAKLPRLSRHLDGLQNAAKDGNTSYEPPLTNVFTMQWFLTLFCNCLPQPTVLRVWDLILMEGNEVLLRTALAIWQVLANRILSVKSADEFYCIMGVLTREILEFGIVDGNGLIKAIVEIGPLEELANLREKYIYNINPWAQSVAKIDIKDRQMRLYGRERLALDISALKKQYTKLKHRQRQAHIIFNAAITRQTPPSAPTVAMNHLLLGKSALVPARRLGPPKGSIPPPRKAPSPKTLDDSTSSSSSSDTELCDDPENPETFSLSPSPPGQFLDDNLAKTSDTFDLMNTKTDNIPGESRFEKTFDCESYPSRSDSEDDGFDLEKFLENRLIKASGSLSEEDEEKEESKRKNSKRAMEIMQENSLILHRILQCQTRLSPTPVQVPSEIEDNTTGFQEEVFGIEEETTEFSGNIAMESSPIYDYKYFTKIDQNDLKSSLSDLTESQLKFDDNNDPYNFPSEIKVDESNSCKIPDYSKILDASKKLEEKYESLILNSDACKFPEDLNFKKSPSFEKSPKSLSPGRIYNPFPINISSRQNKDVAVKLGLYKEQK